MRPELKRLILNARARLEGSPCLGTKRKRMPAVRFEIDGHTFVIADGKQEICRIARALLLRCKPRVFPARPGRGLRDQYNELKNALVKQKNHVQ